MTPDAMQTRFRQVAGEVLIASMSAVPPAERADQVVLVASALLVEAASLFCSIGGRTLAAKEFYAAADHLAAPVEVQP